MKRIALVAAWLLLSAAGWSQDVVRDSVPDTDADDEENVIGARPTPRYKPSEPNLLGAPVYYDLNGNVIGSGERSDSPHLPAHHYLNDRSLHFNEWFVEVENLIGLAGYALGASVTYLPDRFGGYGKVMTFKDLSVFAAGVSTRLSGIGCSLDWHLYGGLLFGVMREKDALLRTPAWGGELGFRIASRVDDNRFCWNSASMGMAVLNGKSYLTIGLGLEIVALTSLVALLWW